MDGDPGPAALPGAAEVRTSATDLARFASDASQALLQGGRLGGVRAGHGAILAYPARADRAGGRAE